MTPLLGSALALAVLLGLFKATNVISYG